MPTPSSIHFELIYPDGERHPIKTSLAEFSVGSGEASDLVITDTDIAPIHFYVSLVGERVSIRPYSFDLESNGASPGRNGAAAPSSGARIANDCIWPAGKPYRFGDYALIFYQLERQVPAASSGYSVEQVFQGLLGPSFNFRLLRFFGVPMSTLMVARWPIMILFASGLTVGALFVYLNRISLPAQPTAVQASSSDLRRTMPQITPTIPEPTAISATATATPTLPRFVAPTLTPIAPSITRTGVLSEGPDVGAVAVAQTPQAPPITFEPTATPIPTATSTPTMRKLNSLLEALGVQVEEAPVNPGETYWHLNDIQWWDVETSGGRHNIFIEVLDENGQRMLNQSLLIWWPDGQVTGITQKPPPDPYAYDYPMAAAGNSYSIKMLELPSDTVRGLGLGTVENRGQNLLTSFILIYQRKQKS